MITTFLSGSRDFINVSVAVTDAAGLRQDPLVANVTFRMVNQTTGALEVVTDIDNDGIVALAQQGGEVGFWGAGVDVRGLPVGEYNVLFEVTTALGTGIGTEHFNITEIGQPIITITPGPAVGATPV